jgi:transposase
MLTLHITPEDLETAKVERYAHLVAKICIRMTVLCLVGIGKAHREVALECGISTKSVKRYIKMYNESGLEGIRQLRYRGPKSQVDAYRSSLESSFRERPVGSANEAAARIEELTGIKLSPCRALAFMKRIGMKCLKMGHIPAKADTDKQRSLYDSTLKPLIELAKEGHCHLFYMDAAHFTLAPFVCMVWCFARLFIKAAAGRNRINVLGAINAKTHHLESIINTTYITATEVVELLKILAQKYGTMPIYLVLDNARYQHCDFVKEQAKQLNIHLVFLTPYSPNLNIIERLWKYLRQQILYGKYYPDAKVFHQAVRAGINSVNTNPLWKQQIASRLSENVQFFDQQHILN